MTSERRRVLMVSYFFPPLGGAGSVRALKFARYLPAAGWEVAVLAPSNGAYYRDPALDASGIVVERAPSLELARLGKRLVAAGGGDTRPARLGPIRRALRRFAHRWVYFPDAHVGWYPMAVRAGRRLAVRGGFDAIFSSSGPITAHLVARRLHRDMGIPWVAEFRDPWADAAAADGAEGRRDQLERSLLNEADAVVTVSPTWGEWFLGKGAAHVHVITNGFDPLELPPSAPAEAFVVTYLGSYYAGLQDLRPLWGALARIRGEQSTPVRIRFVGEIPCSLREEIASYGLMDLLEVTGFLPYAAALAATTASSLLVTAGFRREDSFYGGWIPAKLFEYLGTGLPIVYLGARDTDATRILAGQPACYVVPPGDVDGALEALSEARGQGRVQRDLTPYTRQALARRLAEVLESVRR